MTERTVEMRATRAAGPVTSPAASPRPTLGVGLLAAGAFCLVAAGGLLWWSRGAAVFEDIVSAAIAWCF